MMIETLNTLNRTVKELGVAYFGRPSGSYIQDANGERLTGQTFVDLLRTGIEAGRVENVTEEIPAYAKSSGCQYFRFEIPADLEAYQGADILGRLDVDLDGLRVQEASHKGRDGSPIPEIVTSEIKPLRVDFGHFIVGEHKGEDFIFTAHPGEVLPANPIAGMDQVPADTWATLRIVHDGDTGEATLVSSSAILSTIPQLQTVKLAG